MSTLVRRRRQRDERGSMAVEMAILTPSIFFILALIYAYGRVAQVNGLLETGARDGVRSATIARTMTEAENRANSAVEAALSRAPEACRDTSKVAVIGNFAPDEPITVTVTCTYSFDDLGLPVQLGSVSPESEFTSMLDPYRGLDNSPRGEIP